MANVKKNYIFNLIYQLFSLITPLIVTPHISRALASDGIGQYSFTYSLITYFVLFAAFGFNTYAQREVARFQGDKIEQSKIFWEVLIARSLSVIIALSVNIALIYTNVYGEYALLMWVLSLNIIATLVDVAFFFQGNEKFVIIAILGVIVKTLGVVFILLFVKSKEHVWLYALIQSLSLVLSNILMWIMLPKLLAKVKTKELNVKRHFVPSLRLFIPTIAVSVYTILDRTLIGLMVPGTNDAGQKIAEIENGYYEQSEKIAKMAMMIITSLGTVMIPRNSQAVATGNYDEFKKNIDGALKFVFFLGIPIMFGLAGTAYNFSPWFFGDGYEKVPSLIMIFSTLVVIIGLSNVLGIQYLLPLKKDSKYTTAIIIGAVVNLALNLILIPYLWSYGACIATIVSELVVTCVMFVFSRKDIDFIKVLKLSWKYIVSGTIMFVAVFFTQRVLSPSIPYTLLLVGEGIVCYFGLLFLLRDELLINYAKRGINKIFKKKQKQDDKA